MLHKKFELVDVLHGTPDDDGIYFCIIKGDRCGNYEFLNGKFESSLVTHWFKGIPEQTKETMNDEKFVKVYVSNRLPIVSGNYDCITTDGEYLKDYVYDSVNPLLYWKTKIEFFYEPIFTDGDFFKLLEKCERTLGDVYNCDISEISNFIEKFK